MVETVPRLQIAPFGAPATHALSELIGAVKAGDPLRPVTVVMPSALAAVTVRRALSRHGLVATELVTLPALAPRLAARRMAANEQRPIGSLEARLRVRAALAGRSGRLSDLSHHPATLAALVDTFSELRPLTEGELAALAAGSRRAFEVVDLYRAFRGEVADRADDHDVLAAAAEAVRTGDKLLEEIGEVIVHLPRRLGRADVELLRALAARGRLWAIVGDEQNAAELAPFLGAPSDVMPGARASVEARILRAPDPAEEARIAVRVTLEHLRGGAPADRIAIVSRVSDPYALLIHEELAAVGIEHSAPSPLQLAQSIAGRTLLGLLAWPANGHRRDELMRLLRCAPVRDPAGGSTHPDRWDRLARRAGVVAGLDQWHRRLDEAKRERLERATAPIAAAGAPTLPFDGEQHDATSRIVELDALDSFVERLAAATDPGGRKGWRSLSRWAEGLLVRHLGNEAVAATWSEADRRARAAVIDVLHELAQLEGIGPAV
ncbi:MAG: ATP-dependent helicase/nuclease subunit, partial [Acidimicrobiaceae bacterium]